ncbi:MAG: tetratricopeptide repeat protein [Planctomycetaceae bacterium]
MERVLCCALGVSLSLLAGCSHTTPIAQTRGTEAAPAKTMPNRADLTARINTVEAEAERAKQAGDNASALHAYSRLLLLDPGHVDAHHHLAVAADMEGEFREAEQHYRAALTRDPENADLRTSLGWSLFLQHRDGEALRELQRALELDPEHATALYNMGWLAAHRGEEDKALQYFRRGGTEAQAQALMAKVRLELEDRSARNETQRAVARLGAPSPRGRLSRDEESDITTVQAQAEWEGTQPAAQTRTASLETEQPSVLESPALPSELDEEPESTRLPSMESAVDPAIRHLAERPPVSIVPRKTETLVELPLDAVTPPAEAGELGVESPAVERKAEELGDSVSATQPLTSHRAASKPRAINPPITRREAGSSPELRSGDQSKMGSWAEESPDSGLPPGERVIRTTDSWSAFSTRTLATVGRAMLGKPTVRGETVSRHARTATNEDAALPRETTAAAGESTSIPTPSEIDSELMQAARLGLNLGQPATRRFHVPSPAGEDSE